MKIVNKEGVPQGKWYRCHKREYGVYLCRPKEGVIIRNKLECSSFEVKKSELVVSGLLGEQWTITPQKALSTYKLLGDTTLEKLLENEFFDWNYAITLPYDSEYYAYFLPKEEYADVGLYDLQTDNLDEANYYDDSGKGYRIISHVNSPLSASDHGKGDFLVCTSRDGVPDFSRLWVVDGRIFALTYECDEDISHLLVKVPLLTEGEMPKSLL